MSTHPSFEDVTDIIRNVAAAEILPRFRCLSSDDIREKSGPGDLVTVADVEAERALIKELTALTPGSVVVGEEGVEENPALLDALTGPGPVWVVDPVDGTGNFASGNPCFAVIIAYVVGGETVVGWIHDPINDITAVAAKGEGAWIGRERLQVAPGKPITEMTGSAPRRVRERLAALDGRNGTPVPENLMQWRCTGQEYLAMAQGRLDFVRYGHRLKPWDHAAGILIHAEAGGYSAVAAPAGEPGTPQRYSPAGGILRGVLLAAADKESWSALEPSMVDACRHRA
jgi:fructose-1,6-bisphosphatase/inositol monophosphatase family enzyme